MQIGTVVSFSGCGFENEPARVVLPEDNGWLLVEARGYYYPALPEELKAVSSADVARDLAPE